MTLALDTPSTVPLTTSDEAGGWTYAVLQGSAELFGTRRPVKVRGEIDGTEFAATLLPLGDGTHMLPLKASLRAAIGKCAGDSVTVLLQGRADS
jgi:hypothetical protein